MPMKDEYLIFHLGIGEYIDFASKDRPPEEIIVEAYKKHIGGEIPKISKGAVTIACGDLCLIK